MCPLQYAPFLKTCWIAARRALAHVTGRLYKVYTNTPKSILFSYGQVSSFRSVTGVFKPIRNGFLGVAMNRTDRVRMMADRWATLLSPRKIRVMRL